MQVEHISTVTYGKAEIGIAQQHRTSGAENCIGIQSHNDKKIQREKSSVRQQKSSKEKCRRSKNHALDRNESQTSDSSQDHCCDHAPNGS